MIGKNLKNVKSECKNMIEDEYGVVEKSWVWREWKKLSVMRVKESRVTAESEKRVVSGREWEKSVDGREWEKNGVWRN